MKRAGWIDVFYIVGSREQVKGTFCTIGRREHIDIYNYNANYYICNWRYNYYDFSFAFNSFIFVSIVDITFLNVSVK